MNKIALFLILSFSALAGTVRADEGMWLPLFIERLNYVDMQREGLHLTAAEIYSVNHSSLKDAIIIFGRGCTGEIVSGEGLVLTNHHCGYDEIQSHSTVEKDYLTDGFWATKHSEELPNAGLTARFLVSIADVTQAVLGTVKENMSETEREANIKEISKKLEFSATRDNQYEARVASFFNGNEYYLFCYETYKDVRLVGAPPSSIGRFGADTDNWMWPRHKCDFSMFRIYTSPDGKPAEYSTSNIPLKSKTFLPVSIKGVKEDDFAMILGYPGSTDRFLTSYGVEMALEKTNPSIVKIRTKKLEIIKTDMDANDAIRIQYAAKYASSSNYWKYYIGQSKGLKKLNVIEEKRKIESQFADWVNGNMGRTLKYRDALLNISNAYETLSAVELATRYNAEAINRGCEIISYSRSFNNLADELANTAADKKGMSSITEKLKTAAVKYFKDYNAPTDEKLLSAMLQLFYQDVQVKNQPLLLAEINKKYKGDFTGYSKKVFKESIFTSRERVDKFLQNPSLKVIKKDPAFLLMKAFSANATRIDSLSKASSNLLSKGRRIFVAGLREMMPDKKFYPDANGTMRLTYGKVMGYYPSDAVHYDFVTHLSGLMAKEDSTNEEFIVPAKLKKLYRDKDFGRYGSNGDLVTCFLTDNDITGGNSGSPVLNADGELIGLAFDGNWEAMSGNIAFEPELQRTVCVDIRYVLFVIDKYAGATNLINEMTIRE
jgi:hypothetical protein